MQWTSREITQAVGDAEKLRTELLVVGIFAGGPLVGAARAVDRLTNGRLSGIVQRGELEDAPGATLLVQDLPGAAAVRILLVSLGKAQGFSDEAYRQALAATARALAEGVASEAVVTLVENNVPGRSLAWSVQQAGRVLADGNCRATLPGPKPSARNRQALGVRRIMLLIPKTLTSELIGALRRGMAVAEGLALAEDIGNLPADISPVAFLAGTISAMGEELRFDVEVVERTTLKKLGMEAFLATGGTSANHTRLTVMQYKGRRAKNRPIVLAGTGITFDMNGAGSVLGVLKAVARLRLSVNVVGLIAAAENVREKNVDQPGEILTPMSGQAIGIPDMNQLLLGDMLTYAERLDPACVIDIATSTGDVAAPGNRANDLFANDCALAAELLKCGDDSGESAWRLRPWNDCPAQVRGNFAHTSDPRGRKPDTIAAVSLLGRFTKSYSWAHLNMADRVSVAGQAKDDVDCPVPLLAEFLINRATESARQPKDF